MAKSKSGRNPRSIPTGKRQVNFNAPLSVLEKIEGIAYIEGVSNSEVYNRALEKYIETYEAKKGKIKPKPQGTGLI